MSDLRRRLTPKGALWRHADFLKFWTGQSISELGSQVSQLAIPWVAAVVLHVSPFVFSLLATLGFLPFIIFALPAGVWVDRLRRRPILIFGDVGRAVLLATIPVAYGFGVLTVWQLLAVQFVVGIFTVFFDVAYQSYLPFLVDREHLIEGNAKPEGDEDLRTEYLEDDRVDLSAWVHDAIALALPDKILCRPDCAGLCSVCGKNLNDEPHTHEVEVGDSRWAELEKLREQL